MANADEHIAFSGGSERSKFNVLGRMLSQQELMILLTDIGFKNVSHKSHKQTTLLLIPDNVTDASDSSRQRASNRVKVQHISSFIKVHRLESTIQSHWLASKTKSLSLLSSSKPTTTSKPSKQKRSVASPHHNERSKTDESHHDHKEKEEESETETDGSNESNDSDDDEKQSSKERTSDKVYFCFLDNVSCSTPRQC